MYVGTQQTGHCISQPANPGLLLGHYLYAGDDELDALQPFFSLGILESLAYAAPTYPSQTLIRAKSNPKQSAWPQPFTFTDGKNHHNALGKHSPWNTMSQHPGYWWFSWTDFACTCMWQGKACVLGGAVESQQRTKPLSMHCNIFHICNLFRESAIVGNKFPCTITYKAQDKTYCWADSER